MADLIERAENWNKSHGVLEHETIIANAKILIADLLAALPDPEKPKAKK